MSHAPRLFIDFDGTISAEDTTDQILARFAGPGWLEIEAAWARGEIGSRECMARQVDLLRVTPQALDAFVATLPLDPGFEGFAQLCASRGLAFTVLSDGLDRVAQGALRRIGLRATVVSNHLGASGWQRWRLGFPNARNDCRSAAGNCKCRPLAAQWQGELGPSILIGDGRSDFCGAAEADVVFAKGRLAAHCRERGIPHVAFTGFTDLTPLFLRWLDGEALPARAPAAAPAEAAHAG
ncbi:HAD superfamily phosphoserine phosphatase-like hydrolase/2,3-diketo-5-methylthio-1-phosphopentane phosphatase [Humitalea rosea]|uniref:phosphoserine phosphatase n=1 Tax=Humitalea rosea TaxID=990373 RepID=A0A2W7IPN2_9PROT|nr:HAD-IB family phosphatase [Humitalea rosea]PZW49197.1 HAD superfamily phosphoserine phosphatase-like hydrolase/2,3-diketo-5-methylthio-1-phosphopentane phosphatase [Humitalea rosea]